MQDEDTQPQTESPQEEVTQEANSADSQPVDGVVDVPLEPESAVEEVPAPEPLSEPQVGTPMDDTETEIVPEETNIPIVPPVIDVEPEPTVPASEPAPKIYDLSEPPVKPEEVATEEKLSGDWQEKVEEIQPGGVKPMTVRAEETGDKVYVIVNQKRYWVKNPETLKQLGFNLGQEKKVPFSDLLKWPEGEPADLTVPGAVKPWEKPVDPNEEEKKKESSNVWS